MKKFMLIAMVLLTVAALETQARGIRIPVGEYQKIEKVAELPDSTYYQTEDGKFIDLGYMYTVYEIAFVPLWEVGEPRLVGFNSEDKDTYYDLDDELVEVIKQDLKVEDLDGYKKMPFWDAWGGKLIGLAVIALIIYGIIPSKKKKNEEEEPEEEEKKEE